MVNVLVRDVSSEVHAALVKRADANGISLQQFLLAELSRVAAKPTMAEVMARIERRLAGSPTTDEASDPDVAEYIRDERHRRAEIAAGNEFDDPADAYGGSSAP